MYCSTVKKPIVNLALIVMALTSSGLIGACTNQHLVGGMLGGALVGGAYEYQNKEAMEDLDRLRRSGRISEQEYWRRRAGIEHRSLIY